MTEVQRLNERYDAYLRAGQVCLEARGYQVSKIGASNANFSSIL